MPCYEDPVAYEPYSNEKEYGLSITNEQLLRAVACELAQLVAKNGLIDNITPLAKKWIKNHAEFDKLPKKKK